MSGKWKDGRAAYRIEQREDSSTVISILERVWKEDRLWPIEATLGIFRAPHLVIDISNVEEMGTAAVAQLIAVLREHWATGREAHVCGLAGQPLALCEILGLANLLQEALPPIPAAVPRSHGPHDSPNESSGDNLKDLEQRTPLVAA